MDRLRSRYTRRNSADRICKSQHLFFICAAIIPITMVVMFWKYIHTPDIIDTGQEERILKNIPEVNILKTKTHQKQVDGKLVEYETTLEEIIWRDDKDEIGKTMFVEKSVARELHTGKYIDETITVLTKKMIQEILESERSDKGMNTRTDFPSKKMYDLKADSNKHSANEKQQNAYRADYDADSNKGSEYRKQKNVDGNMKVEAFGKLVNDILKTGENEQDNKVKIVLPSGESIVVSKVDSNKKTHQSTANTVGAERKSCCESDCSTVNGGIPCSPVGGGIPLTTVSGEIPYTTVHGGIPHTTVSGGIPHTQVSGEIPHTPVSGGIPCTTVGGGIPRTKVSGGIPYTTVSGGIPYTTVSGGIPYTTNYLKGEKGEKGEQGETGEQGEKGEKGEPGVTVLSSAKRWPHERCCGDDQSECGDEDNCDDGCSNLDNDCGTVDSCGDDYDSTDDKNNEEEEVDVGKALLALLKTYVDQKNEQNDGEHYTEEEEGYGGEGYEDGDEDESFEGEDDYADDQMEEEHQRDQGGRRYDMDTEPAALGRKTDGSILVDRSGAGCTFWEAMFKKECSFAIFN